MEAPSDLQAWSASDWRAFFEERAGTAEFDGALPREKAEALAFEACVAKWLHQHPVASAPHACAECGGGDRPGDPVLRLANDGSGYAWLHSPCWPDWRRRWRRNAVTALDGMGICNPLSYGNAG